MWKRPVAAGLFAGGRGGAYGPLRSGVPVGSGGAASGAVVIAAVSRGEAWRPVEAGMHLEARAGEGSVDEVVDPALQPLVERVRLVLRKQLAGHGLVESRLGDVEDGLLQAVDGLACSLGDLGQRLALEELLAKLVLGQAEVLGRA